MNTLPKIKDEMQKVANEGGYYISPWRMAEFSKIASKVMNLMAQNNLNVSYAECVVIIDVVKAMLDRCFIDNINDLERR